MSGPHPDVELIAHLRDELSGPTRSRVEAHLAACGQCRQTRAAFEALLADLRATPPPDIHWGRWHAELRGRLDAVRAPRRQWLGRPGWVAVGAAAIVALTLALPLGRALRERPVSHDVVAFDEMAIGTKLDLLQQYQIVERLDLLEDLDVISHLDSLERGRAG